MTMCPIALGYIVKNVLFDCVCMWVHVYMYMYECVCVYDYAWIYEPGV